MLFSSLPLSRPLDDRIILQIPLTYRSFVKEIGFGGTELCYRCPPLVSPRRTLHSTLKASSAVKKLGCCAIHRYYCTLRISDKELVKEEKLLY